jgi:hypothetical protein
MTNPGPDRVDTRVFGRLRGGPVATGIALTAILVVATVVRVLGVRWGLPMMLHPDEWAVVDGIIDMARRNSFEPPWMLRPDHVEMKLDYIAFAAYAQVFRGMSIEAAFHADPAPFYAIARLVTAAFGVGTVALAFLIGRRTSRLVGLVAAALFALFPAFVTHAHYATPDVPLTFALMLMTYALMRYLATASWASLLWSSFAVALAIAIKYPGALGAVMIGIVVVIAAVRDRAWLRVATHGLGSMVAVLGFLFTISPVLFTNFSGVRAELKTQSAGDRLGHPDLGLGGNLWYYLTNYAQTSGVVLLALAVVGLVVVVRRRQLEALPWASGLLVWVALSTLPMTWERWGLPMYVTPLLLAATGLAYLAERFRSIRARWVPLAVGAVVAVQLAAGSAAAVAGLLAPDTRAAALAFAEEHGIRKSNSTFEGYTPFLPGHPDSIFTQLRTVGGRLVPLTEEGRHAKYVVLSSGMYARYLSDPQYRQQQELYQRIFDDLDEIHRVTSTPVAQPSALEPVSIWRNIRFVRDMAEGGTSGPQIRIYAVPSTPKQ